jgi:hypothetical protein
MSEIVLERSLAFLRCTDNGDSLFDVQVRKVIESVNESKSLILEIERFADTYNYDEHTLGNGYKSIVAIYLIALKQTLNFCVKRNGLRAFLFTDNQKLK